MVAGMASSYKLPGLATPLRVVRAGHACEEMKIDLQAIALESQKKRRPNPFGAYPAAK
jgi:hypothetical protein